MVQSSRFGPLRYLLWRWGGDMQTPRVHALLAARRLSGSGPLTAGNTTTVQGLSVGTLALEIFD